MFQDLETSLRAPQLASHECFPSDLTTTTPVTSRRQHFIVKLHTEAVDSGRPDGINRHRATVLRCRPCPQSQPNMEDTFQGHLGECFERRIQRLVSHPRTYAHTAQYVEAISYLDQSLSFSPSLCGARSALAGPGPAKGLSLSRSFSLYLIRPSRD